MTYDTISYSAIGMTSYEVVYDKLFASLTEIGSAVDPDVDHTRVTGMTYFASREVIQSLRGWDE